MQSGKLRRRITIERKNISLSDSGEEVVDWEDVAEVWASIEYDRGYERYANQQNVGRSVARFQFRWSDAVSEVTSEHRVAFDGRTFDITDVRKIGRRVGIEIDAFAKSETPMMVAAGNGDAEALQWGGEELQWGGEVMTWG